MLFREFLLEQKPNVGVLTYIRGNPPTVGHEKVLDKTVDTANKLGATPYLFTSHSQDKKKNPLHVEHKVKLLKALYPEANVGSSNKEMPSVLHVAQHIHKLGHDHLVMVAGSDRVDEYKELLNKYNGTHEKALYNFKSIKVVSAGQRDPDAQGVSGMSGTKLRSHAVAGNKAKFKAGLHSRLSDEHKEEIYHAVRKGMQVTEIYDPHLKISKYQWGEKEGTDHMKKITPGQSKMKTVKEEQHDQLEFDGIQTKNFDMCPSAYKEFKKLIETFRAGGHIGEVSGHEEAMANPDTTVPVQMTAQDTVRKVQAGMAMKPRHLRYMQFKQYLD